jgi:hypothetical protein
MVRTETFFACKLVIDAPLTAVNGALAGASTARQ